MEVKRNYIITVLKIFSSISIQMMILFIIAELIFKLHLDWWYLIILISITSFSSALQYKQITLEILLAEEEEFLADLRNKLDYSRWKLVSETKDTLIVKPRFDRPYSWMYKEKVEITIVEDLAKLTGAKIYVDKIKSIIDNKDSMWDKKAVRYLGNSIFILIILFIVLMKSEVIDEITLKRLYHDYKIRNIEKISFEENLIPGNTEDNINNYGGVVTNKEDIFYVKDSFYIYKADKNFNNETNLVKESSGQELWYLNLIEDWIFYRDGKEIKRIKVDGSESDTIFNLGYTLDLHVLDNWVYFVYFNDDCKVYKMTVNGEDLQKVIDTFVYDIAIYDNKLYYSYSLKEEGYLKYIDLSSGEEKLIANLHVEDMILENNMIYYIDYNDNKLYQYDLLNKQLKQLTEEEITKFLKSEEHIYFMGKGEGGFHPGKGLYKINLNDNSRETIHDNWFMEKINAVGDWVLYKSASNKQQPPALKRIHKGENTVIEMDSGL